jgi:general nucleoside transport system ATP-binding protein
VSAAIEMRGIAKRFRHVVAIRQADLTVEAGEIHALVGENGAGKSTLMNVLYGLYRPDAGTIAIGGETVEAHSPNQAVSMGIGMVHQHFMLVPSFTVLQNIILGIEESRGPFLDPSKTLAELDRLGKTYGLTVDPDAIVGDLPVSMQQRVEILKVLVRGAKVLILDEPTAVLTPQEVTEFFRVLKTLKEAGATVILITHKLREVKALSDRLTVMREGATVKTVPTADVTEKDIAEMMVGRPVLFAVEKGPAKPGKATLEVSGLKLRDAGRTLLDGVDLTVRAGEIVGLAGVTGNGQTELVLGLMGLAPVTGTVRLDGEPIGHLSVRERLDRGMSHVPEDRFRHAFIPDYTVADNYALGLHHRAPFSGSFELDFGEIDRNAQVLNEEFDVRPRAVDVAMRALSGGNQQKIVIAREQSVHRHPKFLIAAMPTRGVDIGAIEFIHKRLIKLRDEGVAILLVSSELSEILSLSDRIAVIFAGKIVREFSPEAATESALGLAMAGAV